MLARMSKKALALLMVFCMVVSALSISALAIELPNGEYDGNFAFEYHITGAALDEMIEGTGYTRDDLSEIKLFFNGGAEKEIEKLPGQDTYMCSILAWELEEKAARNITMLSLTLNNGETSQVLTFGNEDLKAVYYNEILKTAFYELGLSSSAAETYDDAWFFIRTDGVIPVETGSTDYDSGNYTPAHDSTVALKGKVDGTAAWTEYSGVIADDGTINGEKLSEAFASVAAHIKKAPSADAIAAALDSFDPNTQGIVWYVVKEKADDVSSGCPGWHVDGVVYTKGTDEQFRTLTYYMNDGTETAPESHLFAYGTVATVKAGPTREGYDFTGWNTQADGKGTPYAANATINMTEDVNLYAQWEPEDTDPEPSTYTVTYKYEGDVPDSYTAPVDGNEYAKDAEVTVSTEPSHEPLDYSFSGWTVTEPSGISITDGKFTMPEGNVTLTGTWTYTGTEPEPGTYTVTYKYEGSVPSGYTAPVDNNKYAKGDTVTVSAEPTIPANYTFSGWTVTEPSGITITDDGKFAMPEGGVTLTGTWTYTDPGSNPGPSYDYYRVTVNYLDRADGSKIAESYVSPSHIQGSRYDVSEYDAIAIEGYTYDATEGDAVSGILNGNKTVNVYYMADETDIDDGDTPTTDLPDVPGEGDGGETDIGDGQTPTTDLPDTGDNGGETDIPDSGTPTGSLPQTGTLAQTSAARLALGALALTASVAAAGLALLLFRKSRKA
ncbi:InlB B-repeat-containing protein [Pseudoflavonifractor sp.]|uniref:InlB B-repeat-containing protein n=1 Tax=Pseudoflavonifractor sp. TaxID=1980281 RepID=UPI003D910AC0